MHFEMVIWEIYIKEQRYNQTTGKTRMKHVIISRNILHSALTASVAQVLLNLRRVDVLNSKELPLVFVESGMYLANA